jgi:hypothetical protein
MPNQTQIIRIHAILFLLQIAAVALAIGVDSKWSALSVPISAAQVYFPNPFKKE